MHELVYYKSGHSCFVVSVECSYYLRIGAPTKVSVVSEEVSCQTSTRAARHDFNATCMPGVFVAILHVQKPNNTKQTPRERGQVHVGSIRRAASDRVHAYTTKPRRSLGAGPRTRSCTLSQLSCAASLFSSVFYIALLLPRPSLISDLHYCHCLRAEHARKGHGSWDGHPHRRG